MQIAGPLPGFYMNELAGGLRMRTSFGFWGEVAGDAVLQTMTGTVLLGQCHLIEFDDSLTWN